MEERPDPRHRVAEKVTGCPWQQRSTRSHETRKLPWAENLEAMEGFSRGGLRAEIQGWAAHGSGGADDLHHRDVGGGSDGHAGAQVVLPGTPFHPECAHTTLGRFSLAGPRDAELPPLLQPA